MTIAPAFFPLSLQTVLDMNAKPVGGAKIYFYDAETTTPRTVYRDAALTSPHTFPVVCDGFGRIPAIYISTGNYKFVLQDAGGGMIGSADDLPGGTTVVGPSPSSVAGWNTGDLKASYTTSVIDGWVLCNGKSIGSAASSATSRANADCQDLFVALWNADATLAVSGGRGVSASADWSANKSITTPDLRGRIPVGCDGMGNSLAGVLIGYTNPDNIGATGGEAKHTLIADELPVITPTMTLAAAGGHTPAGTNVAVADHQHTGNTNGNGTHIHGIGAVLSSAVGGAGLAAIIAGGAAAQSTDPAGSHIHSFTTDAAGGHMHVFNGVAVPDHTHVATAAPFGSGIGHNNIQPSILCYWQIKL